MSFININFLYNKFFQKIDFFEQNKKKKNILFKLLDNLIIIFN
jgi:hypothetical protein